MVAHMQKRPNVLLRMVAHMGKAPKVLMRIVPHWEGLEVSPQMVAHVKKGPKSLLPMGDDGKHGKWSKVFRADGGTHEHEYKEGARDGVPYSRWTACGIFFGGGGLRRGGGVSGHHVPALPTHNRLVGSNERSR